tara:strand:+ start:5904 stop:6833 length:930 start_codon:yes stop_codon:yes gene_type:complete
MNILFLSEGRSVDYLNDCLLIGLKELYGNSVVDINKCHYLYDSCSADEASNNWGKGFTVTRTIPDNQEVDRNDISSKLKNNFFDLVIYGSITRCNANIEKVLQYVPKNKIALIDGEDHEQLYNDNPEEILKYGVPIFKRELNSDDKRLFPISFAMPTVKVNFNKNKVKDTSSILLTDISKDIPFAYPRFMSGPSTYQFDNETDYYNEYAASRFGFTAKKAGWDCMRHYEIMGNGCIPFFEEMPFCPERTLTDLPKDLIVDMIKEMYYNNQLAPFSEHYERYIDRFEKHFFENNTTKAMAKKFINTMTNL